MSFMTLASFLSREAEGFLPVERDEGGGEAEAVFEDRVEVRRAGV